MCPTSNMQTRAVADMSEYPFMDSAQEKIILKNSINGAFTSEKTKNWIRKELEIK